MLISIPESVALLPNPLWLLVLAMAIDAYLGEMPLVFRVFKHPVVGMGDAITWGETRLNRSDRGETTRKIRGVIMMAVLITIAAGLGFFVHALTRVTAFGFVLELFLVAILIAQKSLHDHVMAVARSLEQAGLAGGRLAVARIVGRDPNQLDQPGVCRASIESLAENLSDGVVAPIFWYVLFGMPGLVVYKMVNTADSMIGHKTERFQSFGWAAARLDDGLNWVPARLTAGLICLAALGPRWSNGREAWKTWIRDGRKHRSPNGGQPEAAMAGALGLALSGPRHYTGERNSMGAEPWIGDGRREATPKDIRRGLHLMKRVCFGMGTALAVSAIGWSLL